MDGRASPCCVSGSCSADWHHLFCARAVRRTLPLASDNMHIHPVSRRTGSCLGWSGCQFGTQRAEQDREQQLGGGPRVARAARVQVVSARVSTIRAIEAVEHRTQVQDLLHVLAVEAGGGGAPRGGGAPPPPRGGGPGTGQAGPWGE